jgi:hypothetical protein
MTDLYDLRFEEIAERFHMDSFKAFRLMATTQFREFDKSDWYSFAGCETKDPMIGENGAYTLVLDGNTLNIIHEEDQYGGQLFQLKQEH